MYGDLAQRRLLCGEEILANPHTVILQQEGAGTLKREDTIQTVLPQDIRLLEGIDVPSPILIAATTRTSVIITTSTLSWVRPTEIVSLGGSGV